MLVMLLPSPLGAVPPPTIRWGSPRALSLHRTPPPVDGMTGDMTHYDVLQIPENASPELINKQWKKLSLKHHPDRDGDPTEMVKVNTAKDVLSDANARMTYDRKLQRERQAREAAAMEAAARGSEDLEAVEMEAVTEMAVG